ncbi:MAG TPA: hypothetical protein VG797_07975 [Phycisphaerales bacterium]|nr:hypothetical protein [Phycisphaerales bacterium]
MPDQRVEHLKWLLEITSIPTAAGKESRVVEWIRAWVAARPGIEMAEDAAGNAVLKQSSRRRAQSSKQDEDIRPPLFFTAHLDHPAFVVERIIGPGTVMMSFRGGVLDAYFEAKPRVVIHAGGGGVVRGVIVETSKGEHFRECVVELEEDRFTAEAQRAQRSEEDENELKMRAAHREDSDEECEDSCAVEVGDVGVWDLPQAYIDGEMARTPACDDLAALAAALSAFDVLRDVDGAEHVRLLFTRAEEIGFVGAIAACKLGTMPMNSRVIALENSRSFPLDSPIGAGPIVRVGDRISTFSPSLTAAVAKTAESIAEARKKSAAEGGLGGGEYKWQRKLMPGGACEASAYQSYGYEATCVCLPLGNYHNMADLERVQAGDAEAMRNARIEPEYIAVSDYHALVDLLVACGVSLEGAEPIRARMEKLHERLKFVLDD